MMFLPRNCSSSGSSSSSNGRRFVHRLMMPRNNCRGNKRYLLPHRLDNLIQQRQVPHLSSETLRDRHGPSSRRWLSSSSSSFLSTSRSEDNSNSNSNNSNGNGNGSGSGNGSGNENSGAEHKHKHKNKRSETTLLQSQSEQVGAWTLLAALEKAKEAQLVEVAALVSSLQALLPLGNGPSEQSQSHPQSQSQSQSQSPPKPPPVREDDFVLEDTRNLTGADVARLLDATRSGRIIEMHTVKALIETATAVFRSKHPDRLVQLPPLEKDQRLQVVGDLHGSLSDLATVLALRNPSNNKNNTNNNNTNHNTNDTMLFNGDLADRGDHGIEVICAVCALKLAYPDNILVNRGNHEDLALVVAYGLASEITHKYGEAARKVLRPTLDGFFRSLPLATVIEGDALIVHAGPPPPTTMLATLATPTTISDGDSSSSSSSDSSKSSPPSPSPSPRLSELLLADHPLLAGSGLSRTVVDTGCLQDNDDDNAISDNVNINFCNDTCEIERASRTVIESMLWSDPIVEPGEETLWDAGDNQNQNHSHSNSNTHIEDRWIPNTSRGAGFRYDASVVRDFLRREGLTRMVRSHEPVREGCARYEIRDDSDSDNDNGDGGATKTMELFTVFSVSRYPYKEGFNQGAILELKANGKHSVLRYATEDDEPVAITAKAKANATTIDDSGTVVGSAPERGEDKDEDEEDHQRAISTAVCTIDPGAILRALREATRYQGPAIYNSLKQKQKQLASTTTTTTTTPTSMSASEGKGEGLLPFDALLDVLIDSLNLENERTSLTTIGAKNALATALGVTCPNTHLPPESVSLEPCCEKLLIGPRMRADAPASHRGPKSTRAIDHSYSYYPWLFSVFDLVDINRTGFVGRFEWGEAVDRINSRLPPERKNARIDADRTWKLLDANDDGKISMVEWELLGRALASSEGGLGLGAMIGGGDGDGSVEE